MGSLFESVAWKETPIGVFDLRRREVPTATGSERVTEVLVNGELLMSSRNTVSERALATSALALHVGGDDLSVLVGGLGLGYTAHAALADPRVGHVRVVDRIPVLFDWLRAGHLPLSAELNDDPRFATVESDVYADLLGDSDTMYDAILIDVDHTPQERLDESSAPFYSINGQHRVARHLNPGGVLGVWSAADDDEFTAVLGDVYAEASREHVTWEDAYLGTLTDVIFLARAAP
ncbi:MAG: spermidine synthase family protein [Planctomycetota bacterium]